MWCLTNTLTNLRSFWPSAALLFLAWCPPLRGDRRSPLQVIAPCRQPKCPRSFITVFVRHHTRNLKGSTRDAAFHAADFLTFAICLMAKAVAASLRSCA